MTLVLIVDDVPAMAEGYAYDLKRLGGYDVQVAGDGREALEVLAAEPVDCVLLDLELPGLDGFDVLRAMKQQGIEAPVIVYTGTGNYDRCVQAIRLGAYNFIDKAEPMERVVREIENALERRHLVGEIRSLRRELGSDTALVGSHPAMERLRESVARHAPIPSPVLLVGESGSGKELVARELHRRGPNAREPFVALNSAAIPESLVESELFGHERGAFTGAIRMRRGAFELAGRGTLFLDEIAELPLPAQAKLLRVLEDLAVTRVGGERPVAVRARVVAATHCDLEVEVEGGRFRQDLLYRLNVHVLRVPPLREHLSDVPALVHHFLDLTCERFGIPKKRAHPDLFRVLMAYDWRRNNVRELRNIVERMVIAAEGETIGPEHVPAEIGNEATPASFLETRSSPQTLHALRAEAERQIIVHALERNDWHITRTAKDLGLADHSSLLKIMRRHNIVRGA